MKCISENNYMTSTCFILANKMSGFPSLQYLGLVEVEESRGMHVCEEAVKKLKVVSINTHAQLLPLLVIFIS